MAMRSASTATSSTGGRATSHGGQLGWRSHTFADGVHSITLTRPLDAPTAGRLRRRLAELIAGGCRRLIVDASPIEPSGREPALLASAFAGRAASCEAIVVTSRESSLVRLLPAWVGIVWTLDGARRQLAARAPTTPWPATWPSRRQPAHARDAQG